MAVINTQQLLNTISKLSNQQSNRKVEEIQREMICTPLKAFFPNVSQEQIYYELLGNGLFDHTEIIEVNKVVKELEEKKIWLIVEAEYERLKLLWNGPEVPIYIYPLTKYRPILEGIEVNKNGVTYNDVLFLFVTPELVETELKALLAHEYHHICRLAFLNKLPKEMMLLDSLIIEGMAECAVEELYGEQWLSPWTKSYSIEEAMMIWRKRFVPVLNLKGVKNHRSFLYGDGSKELPNWIGYCIGYKIVQSFLKKRGFLEQHILYKTLADKIVEESDFKI
ncbi:DUF2268 domain-containing protein [Ureibacillus sp. NPDC094379]